MYGGEKVQKGVWWRNLRESVLMKDLGVDVGIIKMNLQDIRSENMDETPLTQERKRRWAFLS